jgi:hypothetical protein
MTLSAATCVNETIFMRNYRSLDSGLIFPISIHWLLSDQMSIYMSQKRGPNFVITVNVEMSVSGHVKTMTFSHDLDYWHWGDAWRYEQSAKNAVWPRV